MVSTLFWPKTPTIPNGQKGEINGNAMGTKFPTSTSNKEATYFLKICAIIVTEKMGILK